MAKMLCLLSKDVFIMVMIERKIKKEKEWKTVEVFWDQIKRRLM